MITVGQLVDSADLPHERKEPVKQVLLQLGFPASRTVGKAFRSLNEKHLTDHDHLSQMPSPYLQSYHPPQVRAHT